MARGAATPIGHLVINHTLLVFYLNSEVWIGTEANSGAGMMCRGPVVLLSAWVEAINACAVQWCRKQDGAVLLLLALKVALHTIAAKSLPNWIIQSSHIHGRQSTFVCTTIKSVTEAWRVVSLRHQVALQWRDCFHWKQFGWLEELWLWAGMWATLISVIVLGPCLTVISNTHSQCGIFTVWWWSDGFLAVFDHRHLGFVNNVFTVSQTQGIQEMNEMHYAELCCKYY